ncbi:nucleotide disphospho-sugar-binding domain-containing protein [Streptomyces sp. NPDC006512]|uniref:nucleotide disphospho-sugar-binding domain-containing protein n=1 Tax=Streptomyces sp. NPDC006512 TaxID=3154307 RepID=UPI0033AF243F
MKILFVGGNGAGTIFPDIPLAQAARNAGHEVIMTGPEVTMSAIINSGIPAVSVTRSTIQDCRYDRQGNLVQTPADGPERNIAIGRMFGRLAASSLPGLLELVDRWQPDLVVSNVLAYAGPLAAHHAGVPWVRFATDIGEPLSVDLAAVSELAPELEALGLQAPPAPDFSISVMPSSVRPATAPPALSLRHIACSTQLPLEPWMYAKDSRPRVLVSAGSRVTPDDDFDSLSGLVEKVGSLDVELLVATPDDVAAKLEPLLPAGSRAGWLPVDVLAPTCDLMVHHAGGNITLTCLAYGIPQVFVPNMPGLEDHGARISAYGAGVQILPADNTTGNIAGAVGELLGNPSYREAAGRLRDEVHRMPSAAQLVQDLERSVHVHREAARGLG